MDYSTSNNPLLTRAFRAVSAEDEMMTFDGTASKTLALLAVMIAGAATVMSLDLPRLGVALAALVGGIVLVVVTVMNTRAARITAVPWSFLQGVLLGTVSASVERSTHGVVGLAVALTAAAAAAMLMAFQTGLIRPTARFRAGVVGATGAIALVYVASFVLELAGSASPFASIGDSGVVGIGATVAILTVAALNLVLDFDFIERAVEKGAPRSMEWFAAFSLTVTLIWIYVQFLDLLGGDD